ncbi:MAG: hypothetical protein QF765_07235 [Candidatus Marinimicrobia bacterium]|nr:hypothetical protein [Candidatus Neomarinimicrobiota bacterium]
MKRLILLLFTLMFSCTSYFISDTNLPEDVKIVSEDYPLYDGKVIRIIGNDRDYTSSSLSGRRQYMWEELSEKHGTVMGEYELPDGRYYIVEMDDLLLIKIPSVIFLKVVIFPDENEYNF